MPAAPATPTPTPYELVHARDGYLAAALQDWLCLGWHLAGFTWFERDEEWVIVMTNPTGGELPLPRWPFPRTHWAARHRD